jgi:WD40 repeat protein/hemolysin type calcium-binding protein
MVDRRTRGERDRGWGWLRLGLSLLGCTVGLALLPLTSAAFPGGNGDIVFSTNRDANYEIYTMTLSGGSQTNRTNNAADDTNPAFSADASKIAFVRGTDIYTMDADGTDVSNPAIATGDEPFWSPDGTTIAYVSGGNILKVSAAGGSPTTLTPGSSPAWSPDGTKIAFVNGGDIWVIPAAGGSTTNLTNSAATDSAPNWSPDGSKIAVISTLHEAAGELYAMSSDGATMTRLTTNTSAETFPSWSPDGTRIAFARDTGGNIDIWSVDFAGGSPYPATQLTTAPGTDRQPDWGRSAVAPVVVPVNTGAPVITGAATVGTTLSTSNGSWTGSPTSYTYQWKRCDSGGGNCIFITGQTSSTYTIVTGDVGSTLKVDVTASNSAGPSTSPGTSAQTAVVTGTATGVPVNLTAPAITGTARVGSPLTTTVGTWNPVATSYTYQWKRCDAAGTNCTTTITGATAATYTPVAADLNLRLVAAVTAVNATGPSTPKDSLPTDVVAAAGAVALANTVRPVISGSPAVGQTLTTTDGTWTSTPTTLTYQWRRCNATTEACANITGATTKTYVVVAADSGSKLAVVVTASNTTGTANATADLTAVVGSAGPAARPLNKATPVVSGQAANGQTLRATNGEWNGSTPMTFAYQWQACDKNVVTCTPVEGATASTFTITSKQIGKRLRVRVTATNTAGSAAIASQATAPVAGQASPTAGRKLVGTAKNDKLIGTARNDTLDGRAGNDTLKGLAGNDLLLGGPGNDKLYGGTGVDGLNGGPGRDLLSAGAGNDAVNAAGDGARDVVDCGAGKDRATVGRTDVVRNCETVKRKKR